MQLLPVLGILPGLLIPSLLGAYTDRSYPARNTFEHSGYSATERGGILGCAGVAELMATFRPCRIAAAIQNLGTARLPRTIWSGWAGAELRVPTS